MLEQEYIFRQGLEACPGSAQLHSHFANFLTDSVKKFTEASEEHKKALDLDPANPTVLANYAVFCAYTLQDLRTAESLFKRALASNERDQDDDLHYKYALFLARSGRAEDTTIRQHFKTAIFKGPKNCLAYANYAWWLLSRGSWLEASRFVDGALKQVPLHMQQLCCELLLYKSLIVRLHGQDDSSYLAKIKAILNVPFPKVVWPLRKSLNIINTTEPLREDLEFYAAICDIITDDNKQESLSNSIRWNNLIC
ncbi:MAG: hypothetical protein U1E33_08345 [Rhodospirillales bacterium]